MKILAVTSALAACASSLAFTGGRLDAVRTSSVVALAGKRSGDDAMPTRREMMQSLVIGAASVGLIASPEEVLAFPNKISNQYDDRPKQRGSKPKGLGVAMRKDLAGEEYLGLKECGAGM